MVDQEWHASFAATVIASTMELAPMNRDLYIHVLAGIGHWWTRSGTWGIYQRGKHVVVKHKTRALAHRYHLTYFRQGSMTNPQTLVTKNQGIKMIQFIEAKAGVSMSDEDAAERWDTMSWGRREQTVAAYSHLGGPLLCW